MNRNVIITCAITGAGDTTDKSENVPVTPEQIAVSALEAAKAGAAIVHCHVRDPETGKGSRNPDYYEEVVNRIREKDSEVIINLTAGMGGDLVIGPDSDPMDFGEGTDLVGAQERLQHALHGSDPSKIRIAIKYARATGVDAVSFSPKRL